MSITYDEDQLPTTGKPNNSVATRRHEYGEFLAEAYSANLGSWLERQTAVKQARISRKALNLKHGLAVSAPLNCLGPERCPFYAACPIPDQPGQILPRDEYPINMSCVLEVEYVGQQLVDYMRELDVDPANPVEMSLINELALLDLLRNRAVLILSHGDRRGHGRDMLTVDESIVGWSDDGQPLTSQSTKAHPAVDIMERHEKRRGRILEQFAATRASKFRLYGGNLESNTELNNQLIAIREHLTQLSTNGVSMKHLGTSSADEHSGLFNPIEEIR